MVNTGELEMLHNDEWDRFLESHPLGQFQQSTKWARVKAVDGWAVRGLGLAAEPGHLWGAQILLRKTRLGMVGYVTKGPVLVEEKPQLVQTAIKEIVCAARRLEVRVLILQPPDESKISTADLVACGFLPCSVPGIINATALVELAGGRAAIEARISRKQKQHARRARDRGVTMRLGTKDDLTVFFGLMTQTCRRLGVTPNPSRIEAFEAIWDSFQPKVSVAFARYDGADIAGLFVFGFGDRCTFWKKGWNDSSVSLHPNALLNIEMILWAATQGYKVVDFGGLDRTIAEALIAGRALTPDQERSRDIFNLRLGARPKLLPHAHIFVPNARLRRLVDISCRIPILWGMFKALARG